MLLSRRGRTVLRREAKDLDTPVRERARTTNANARHEDRSPGVRSERIESLRQLSERDARRTLRKKFAQCVNEDKIILHTHAHAQFAFDVRLFHISIY